jgi:hypothetical protein
MAREIRAPEQVTGFRDRAALLLYARALAAIVARNTLHSERHVAECVMRVVGHLCATGGDSE